MTRGYTTKLTHKEILKLFDEGVYHVDLDTGIISSARTKTQIYTYAEDDRYPGKKHLFVRLYWGGRYKALPVSHVVWIVGTRSPIPEGFEVHHRDTDVQNNAFFNLFALHRLDHYKLHAGGLLKEGPF